MPSLVASVDGDQRLVVVVVDVGEVGQLVAGQPDHRPEEAQLARLRAHPRESAVECLAVPRSNGPYLDPASIAELDLGPHRRNASEARAHPSLRPRGA